MSAEVVPFPKTRDRDFIRRRALRMAAYKTTEAAENYLAGELQRILTLLRRKQVPAHSALREAASIEAAIRSELWNVVMASGSA